MAVRLIGVDSTLQRLPAGVVDATMPYLDAKSHSAVGNGSANDTTAIQAMLNTVAVGGVIELPDGTYKITAPLTVPVACTIRGAGMYTTILLCVGCSGFQVASGVTSVRLENLEIAASVRHDTTPNAYTGIAVAGATGARPQNHLYRNVYIDGFQTAIATDWLWSSRFQNVRCNHGQFGINATNLSVNNVVNDCSLAGDFSSGSIGILLDGTTTPSEGWVITDSIIDAFQTGISMLSVTHCNIGDNIIDHCYDRCILFDDNGTNFAGNTTIHDNYMAIGGTAGTAAIDLESTPANTSAIGVRIHDNHITSYSGSACPYGIYVADTSSAAVITGNTIRGFTTADIRTQRLGNVISNNRMMSSISNNLYSTFLNVVSDNVGSVYIGTGTTTPNSYVAIGRMKMTYTSTGPPANGTWTIGDVSWNYAVAAAGDPIGWQCVATGTPGTWVEMPGLGALDADLATIAGLTATTNNMIQSVGSAWASRTPAQIRTALGLDVAATVPNLEGATGDYWSNPASRGTGAIVVGTMYLHSFYVVRDCTIDRIGASVTGAGAASSTVTLGIYEDNGLGSPDVLILDAGTIDGTSATAQEKTISQALTGGKRYWFAALGAVGTPTMRIDRDDIASGWVGRHTSLATALGTTLIRQGRVRTGLSGTALPSPAGTTAIGTNIVTVAVRLA